MRNLKKIFFVVFVAYFYETKQEISAMDHNQLCTSNNLCVCVVARDGYIKADCSGKHLRNFPNIFGNVISIDLSYNELQEVPEGVSFPSTLEELSLSVNNISRLDVDAFRNLSSLRVLNLAYNSLQYNESVFKPGVFSALSSLDTLLLHHNIADNISLDFYPTAISELKSLTTLALDGRDGARFPRSFQGIKTLQRITISGMKGKCDIKWLPEHFFLNTPFVKYLDLTGCNLQQMDKKLLQPLRSLTFLNISHNNLLTFNVLPNISYDLQWTKIKLLDLTKIHCTYGPGTMLFTNDTVFLKKTGLETLILDSNRLVMMDAKVILNFPKSLKEIYFRDNRMTMGLYVYYSIFLHGLKVLNGDNQHSSHNPDDDTNRFQFCNDWRSPRSQNVQSLPTQAIQHIPLAGNLSEIYFANSDLEYPIPELFFSNNSVTNIVLNNNKLFLWIGPVHNLHQLIYLDLSNNFCSKIKSSFLIDVPLLKFLNISNNFLGYNLDNDLPFKYLRKIETLDFSFNYVQNLSKRIFANLTSLRYLHLQHNSLRDWQFDVGHMKELKYLDLSFNQLTTIPERIRNQLDGIITQNTLKIRSHGNRFRCDCQTMDFLKWILKTNREYTVFENFDTYSCSTKNDSIIPFSNLSDFVKELEVSCRNNILLIIGISLSIVTIIGFVVAGFIYRYRWRLRYLYLMTKAKFLGHIIPRQPEHEYKYDAFISYADEDREFVHTKVVKELEEKFGLKLCLHESEFLPGQSVRENILRAVHNSRRTIAILSEDYVKSYWCKFEFHMAATEGFYYREGANIICLVKYKAVKKLPLDILKLMKSNTYLEFPNDPEIGDKAFCNKLAESIRS